MRKSRIAVVGVGMMGRRHVELVRAHPECVLSGVVDPAPVAAELALAAGVPYVPMLAGREQGQSAMRKKDDV